MLKHLAIAALLSTVLSHAAFGDSLGSASGGAAANQSNLAGCKYNVTPPALSDGQQVAQQCDSTGNTKTTTTVNPGSRTIVPLDVSTVTTGGVAVTALNSGHRTAGGFLFNPKGATIDLCINEQGVASGTTSSGALTCVPPGTSYNLTPAAGAVSVITSDSSHPFSGYGLN